MFIAQLGLVVTISAGINRIAYPVAVKVAAEEFASLGLNMDKE